MLALSTTDGTVVYNFTLCAGFFFRMVLQESRRGLCLFSATLAVVSQMRIFGGKGKIVSRDVGRRTQGRYRTCSRRTNVVAPRTVLHTHTQASGDVEVVSCRPQWIY